MKSYTDLEQSKKLEKILPFESADMWWAERYAGRVENYEYIVEEKPVYYLSFTKPSEENYSQDTIKDIPCWSLAALLSVLPYYPDLSKHTDEKWYITTYPNNINTCLMAFNNPIDACVAMIENLHEQKLL